jgi:hypothetical protein
MELIQFYWKLDVINVVVNSPDVLMNGGITDDALNTFCAARFFY